MIADSMIAELPSGERLRIELRSRRSRAPRRKYKAIKGGSKLGGARFKDGSLMFAYRLEWKRRYSGSANGIETGSATFRKPIEAIAYCKRFNVDSGIVTGSDTMKTGDFTLTYTKGEA